MDESYFNLLVIVWVLSGLMIFPVLLKITAPYGRHTKSNWGPVIDNRLGWIIMEAPSLFIFCLVFIMGTATKDPVKWIFFALWTGHYINRVFIYPFRTRTRNKKIPLLIVVFAIFFNFANAILNAYWLGYISPAYGLSWLADPRFILGMALFIAGVVINHNADNNLLRLRKNSSNGYFIPKGGLFKYISCPNFFGEMIEWTGFALMVWSLPAFSFALWTWVNLMPRALDHHKWYKSHFDDYPPERKAVIPFVL